LDASYYRRQSERRLFYVGAKARVGHELDLDNRLELGGQTGMRGYPLRYQNGEKSLLLSVEQRFFTDWYPLRLFHVGAAAFFDVGRMWGEQSSTGEELGWQRDVGFGLRLGNSRSALGRVIHIDVAVPLDGDEGIDGVQFLIGTKTKF
jgi:outer membrane protein assembly factor BamA